MGERAQLKGEELLDRGSTARGGTRERLDMLKLIIINYNIYGLICNKYILYNGLSNYIRNEVIKLCIGFIIYYEKWVL
jgi:hypothetical protein